jgi:hypothetical protein
MVAQQKTFLDQPRIKGIEQQLVNISLAMLAKASIRLVPKALSIKSSMVTSQFSVKEVLVAHVHRHSFHRMALARGETEIMKKPSASGPKRKS